MKREQIRQGTLANVRTGENKKKKCPYRKNGNGEKGSDHGQVRTVDLSIDW
jgi:hypothetical protein